MNELLIALLLLIIAGGIVCVETAFITLGRAKVHRLVDKKKRGSSSVQVLYRSIDQFTTTAKITVLLLIILTAALSGLLIARIVEPYIQTISYGWIQSISSPASLLIAGLVLIIIIQLFVYLLPRFFGRQYSRPIALFFSPFARGLTVIMYPLVSFITGITRLLSQMSGKPNPLHLSKSELLHSIDEGRRTGIIDAPEYEIINRVLSFAETTAKEIMIPRPDIVALEIDAPRKEIIKVVTEEGFSRIPVYKDTIDSIAGIVYAKDLINMMEYKETVTLADIIRPATFVPETKKISQLLREFQQQNIHLAIVIDEFGGTEGIITLEDIIEEIVGEIHDEYDEVKQSYIQQTDGTWVVDGGMNVSEFNETFSAQLPEDVDYETINGFLHKITGRIPDMNEEIQFGNLSFTIMRKSKRRIEKIRVKRYHQSNIP
jgi:putative hemolysin